MSREQIDKQVRFYNIIDGTFRQKVDQNHPDAVRRDWKSADGKMSGTKYERVVNALFGYIKDIQFVQGEYGLNIHITLDENEDGESPVISLGSASREGEDFLKKLPNVDLSKEVRLRPFAFDGDENREVRGLEIMQQDEEGSFTNKITNFFRDQDKKENINGYPNPPKENMDMDADDWKVYFIQARKFLIEYIKENVSPKLTPQGKKDMAHDVALESLGQPNPDDIPF